MDVALYTVHATGNFPSIEDSRSHQSSKTAREASGHEDVVIFG